MLGVLTFLQSRGAQVCLSAASGGLGVAQRAPLAIHAPHQCQPVQTLGHCSTLCCGALLREEAQFHAMHLQRYTLLHYKLFTTRRYDNEQQRATTTAP